MGVEYKLFLQRNRIVKLQGQMSKIAQSHKNIELKIFRRGRRGTEINISLQEKENKNLFLKDLTGKISYFLLQEQIGMGIQRREGGMIRCDYPIKGQIGFQEPGTKNMEGVMEQNERIMFYQIIVLIVVIWFLISSINNKYYVQLAHGNLIELIWTQTPAGILWGIGIPSQRLLYVQDEIQESEQTVKAIGNQWYWNYELTDKKEIIIESYMLDETSLELGDIRLLTVDNELILPIQTNIRLLVTSNDVIHSFAIPSLGQKSDAIPGRLNATGQIINRTSNYYGQCSELCGVLHGFMPISIKAVTINEYQNYQRNENQGKKGKK